MGDATIAGLTVTAALIPELYEEGYVCDAISLCALSFQREKCSHHGFSIEQTLSTCIDKLNVIPIFFPLKT